MHIRPITKSRKLNSI